MHGAFDAADAPLIESHLGIERFDAHQQRLQLEADLRHLRDEPLHDFIVKRVPFRLLPVAVGVAFGRVHVQPRLQVQCVDQWVRVKEQLQQRVEQPPYQTEGAPVRVVDRSVLERERRWHSVDGACGARSCRAPQRVQQRRLDRARVEDGFEAPCSQVLDLLVRQVDALALVNAAANVPHDLLHVHLVASGPLLRVRLLRAPVHAATVRPSPAALEVASSSFLLWFHECQYFLKSCPHSVRMNERMRERPMVGYQNTSWYTLDANGAHTISGEWSSKRSSGRRKPLRII